MIFKNLKKSSESIFGIKHYFDCVHIRGAWGCVLKDHLHKVKTLGV
jgi:hypothetical protein